MLTDQVILIEAAYGQFTDSYSVTVKNTLGNATVYNSTSSALNRRAIPVTFNENAVIRSLSIYHNGGEGSVLMAVYDDISGYPGSRLGVTSSTTVNVNEGWQTIELVSPLSVSSGQTVWLAFVFENNIGIKYQTATSGRASSIQTWADGMPDEFGASGLANYTYSLYCNYSIDVTSDYSNGNTTIYSTTSTAPNRRAIPVTFNENGEINSISVYHNGVQETCYWGFILTWRGNLQRDWEMTSSVTAMLLKVGRRLPSR
ncbi:MAG: hypothetical protein IPF54_14480 [Draconibacterium sp.]|nr:hypothetical protein [Draconibacterium sp.]